MNQLQNQAIYSHVLTLKLGDRSRERRAARLAAPPLQADHPAHRFSAGQRRPKAAGACSAALPQRGQRPWRQTAGRCGQPRADRDRNRLPAQGSAGIHRGGSHRAGMGEALHLSDLKLPEGVELATHVAPGSELDAIVASIHHPHGGEEAQTVAAPTTPPAAG